MQKQTIANHSVSNENTGVAPDFLRAQLVKLGGRRRGWLSLASCAALTLAATACTETSPTTQNAAQARDFAAGVDAEFGVETFALGAPTIKITSPLNYAAFTEVAPGAKVDVSVNYTLTDFVMGTAHCYLDGKFVGDTSASPFKFIGIPKGLHTLSCVLANVQGADLLNAEARAVVQVKVTESCLANTDCDDGQACSVDSCQFNACVYQPVGLCCGSKFDCTAA